MTPGRRLQERNAATTCSHPRILVHPAGLHGQEDAKRRAVVLGGEGWDSAAARATPPAGSAAIGPEPSPRPASRGRPKVVRGGGGRDPALRASRSTAWPSANVTTAVPKPAGNKLGLRAAGIGHDEGGGRVAHGATTGRRRGTGERPPYPARGGRLGSFARHRRPGHSSCVFLRDPVKYI
jgi:hypothetical protein